MANSVIRWTKDDRANLRRAVNNFNSKISRLEKLGRENLPEKVSYKELIGMSKSPENAIYSRNELRNTINSLKRFSKRGAEDIVKLPSGQELTRWERAELGYKKARAIRRLNREIDEVSATSWNFGLGDALLQTLEATKESIENISTKKGYELKMAKRLLESQSRADREIRKAIVWEQNFNKALDSLKNFENFDLLKDKLDSIKNPIKKWEYINQTEILKDLFLWYNTEEINNPSTQTYGGFISNQDAFNRALEDLGLL